MPRLVLVFSVLGASLTFGSAIAGAQEDGVTIDSGAPTAKEYALPLESARRELTGGKDQPVQQGARDAPMFGAGVSRETTSDPPAETRPSEPTQRTSSDDDVDAGPTGAGGSVPGGDASAPPASGGSPGASAPATSTSGPSSTTALLGGGAGVLLLTLLGGLALRAVRGPD